MSRVDTLLSDLAPEGVLFPALGDVASISGRIVQPKAMGAQQVQIYSLPSFDNGKVPESLPGSDVGSAKSRLSAPCILVAKLNPHIPRVWRLETVPEQSYCSPEFYPIEPDPNVLDLSYLFYFLLTKMARLSGTVTGSTNSHKRLHREDFLKLRIPLPPLEVQREIVHILDNFTSLQEDLDAELRHRRRQYSFYRNSFVASPRGEFRRLALGAIADFRYGYTTSAKDEGDYRFLRITDINQWGKLSPSGAKFVEAGPGAEEYLVRSGDLLMARTGATYGKTMLVDSDDPAVYASFLIRIRLDPNIMLPAYYWHFAQSDLYWSQANAMVSTGGQPQFNANVLKVVEIPVPSLDEQARIIALLDKFDALANDGSIGLPAEIAARRKQYEFYRDRLLTFEEAAA